MTEVHVFLDVSIEFVRLEMSFSLSCTYLDDEIHQLHSDGCVNNRVTIE